MSSSPKPEQLAYELVVAGEVTPPKRWTGTRYLASIATSPLWWGGRMVRVASTT